MRVQTVAPEQRPRRVIRDFYALNAAIECLELGLRVTPLKHPRGERKKPQEDKWGLKTTLDADELIAKFEKWPKSGFELKMGQYPQGDTIPGVIDIEHDTDEGRATANRIFGDWCVTPTYTSERSIHRLFLWREFMPRKQKDETLGGLEIRIGGDDRQTHSVMPPSLHDSGRRYQWLPDLSISECAISEVPHEIEDHLRHVAENTSSSPRPGPLPRDQWRQYSRREVACARYLLSLCESKHANDYDSWFGLATAAKTIGGEALRDDWLRLAAIATKPRDRYRRADAIRKWRQDIKPNGTASIHTIERIVLGDAMPADFWALSGVVDFDDGDIDENIEQVALIKGTETNQHTGGEACQ